MYNMIKEQTIDACKNGEIKIEGLNKRQVKKRFDESAPLHQYHWKKARRKN